MTGARKPNVKEPVVVEDEPKVVEAEPLPVKEPEPDVPDEGEKANDEPEPEGWFPGRPCLNCGSTGYQWTLQWGATCSECSPEGVAARKTAEE